MIRDTFVSCRAPKKRKGQAMVEAALVLLVVLAILIGTLDFGQILFTHQAMVERVRGALRWSIVRAYDGTGDATANMVLYNQATVPAGATTGYLGLTRSNVQVTYTPPTAANPNDERMKLAIVNYQYHFFSPWIAKSFANNSAVIESAGMVYKP